VSGAISSSDLAHERPEAPAPTITTKKKKKRKEKKKSSSCNKLPYGSFPLPFLGVVVRFGEDNPALGGFEAELSNSCLI
jgi:hypothetical protein